MNFLEAHKIVTGFTGGPTLRFLLGVSGMADKLDVFLRAAGAVRGQSVAAKVLPFNTLGQKLVSPAAGDEREVFVLFPWDFVPEADWRSGLVSSPLAFEAVADRAREIGARLAARPTARALYVPAPLPPIFSNPKATARLAATLIGSASDAGADLLAPEVFSLASYLSNGCPFASAHLGTVAEAVVDAALTRVAEPKKVLVTDLDNVMWRGVIGEDGMEGIRFAPEGAGFRHFVYQSLLKKVKQEGTLLAAVSRNDHDLATQPFRSGRMTLALDDFVAVTASYNAKSSQIRELARQLNLGLSSFVFVDDNPIELEEVGAALPEVRAVQFPLSDDALPSFLNELANLFARDAITAEDADRTAMYRRRLEGMAPVDAAGADLTTFLRGLSMELTIHDRSVGDRARAVQLINKTNQFNLNGVRVTDEKVADVLSAGGRLLTASLSDRTGSHGEILACLIDGSGVVRSLVMSCRVFQRRVEHAFFAWLRGRENPPSTLDFAPTPRNEPMTQFLQALSFAAGPDGMVAIDWTRFGPELELFVLHEPDASSAPAVG